MVMLGIIMPGEAPLHLHPEILQQPDIIMGKAGPHPHDYPFALQLLHNFLQLRGGKLLLLG
ncbi:hypothetical protein D3C75_1347480 [compost metagenome]